MEKLVVLRKILRVFLGWRHYWVISDRPTIAGDNGEALFKYLQNKKGITPVFAIQTDGEDYARMKKIGKVVVPWTLMHKVILCSADVYLSSQLGHFEKQHTETPFVFLQHGVAEKDISGYVNPYCRDNFYIVGSTFYEEYQFKKKPYEVRPENVMITGLPRFDYLNNKDKKIIMISLTWEQSLAQFNNPTAEDFRCSNYYKNTVDIMNSSKIKECAEKNGYQIYVCVHPMINSFIDVFRCPEHIGLWEKDYASMFEQCSVLITDYSSIVNDFAILHKPVVYYQPKDKGIQSSHAWNICDFSYEDDGLGEVTSSLSELETIMCEYIENGCSMKEKYLRRLEKSFVYLDRNNSDRVYQKTLEIINQK